MTPPDRGRRLSRSAVVEAAVRYVDDHGLAALTMRELGQVLGVEAMSIYHYVNGREDLLEAMVDELTGQVEIPAHDSMGPVDGWQAFLQHVGHDIRTVAVRHPNLFPLIATRPPAAPWLRPPLRSLRVVEAFLDGLEARGLDDEQAVHVYKVFTSFLLGHLLLEVSQLGVPTGPPDEPLDEGDAAQDDGQQLDVDAFPTLRQLQPLLARHDPEIDFEAALESLLDRLDGELGH